mmetsp:Transcript_28419/g.57716  ORF Transcript_28419/g.57716 Transcript_28419/m.57716 type:complete len:211 (+) Transcript_28419:1006-1638(+)
MVSSSDQLESGEVYGRRLGGPRQQVLAKVQLFVAWCDTPEVPGVDHGCGWGVHGKGPAGNLDRQAGHDCQRRILWFRNSCSQTEARAGDQRSGLNAELGPPGQTKVSNGESLSPAALRSASHVKPWPLSDPGCDMQNTQTNMQHTLEQCASVGELVAAAKVILSMSRLSGTGIVVDRHRPWGPNSLNAASLEVASVSRGSERPVRRGVRH